MSSGYTRFRAYDPETDSLDLTVLLSDLDRRKGMKIPCPSGDLYLRAGLEDDFDVAKLGSGGGFCWRRDLPRRRTRSLVETALERTEQVEYDDTIEINPVDELYPRKLRDTH